MAKILTICVISHRQTQLVMRLLDSLEAHRPEFDFQVAVLENVHGSPPVPVGRYSFEVIYHQNDVQVGLSKNINTIYYKFGATTEYFCILNPDIVFRQEVFSPLIDTMQAHHLDIISPLLVDHNGAVQDSFRSVPTPINIILRYLGLSKTEYHIDTLPDISHPDWIGAMFMLMPGRVFEALGGFDQKYYLYFEDVDLCLRAKQMGVQIGVTKQVTVVHDAQRRSHTNISYLLRHVVSAFKFFTSPVYTKARH